MTTDWRDWYDEGEGPFYTEYLGKLQKTDSRLGLARAFDEVGVYNNLAKIKDSAIKTYNQYFAQREIGGETEEMFQHITNRVLLEIQERYDYLVQLTEDNYNRLTSTTMSTDRTRSASDTARDRGQDIRVTNTEGKTDYGRTVTDASTDVTDTTSQSTYNDTPVTALMDEANYASNITDGKGNQNTKRDATTTQGGSDMNSGTENVSLDTSRTHEGSEKETESTEESKELAVIEMEQMFEAYIPVVIRFVTEFKRTFINEVTKI